MSAFIQIQMQDFTATLPKRLVEVRKLQGLTQVQVAEALGTTQGTYALYESGARGISLKLLPKLAKALNTSEESLLGFEPKKSKRGPASALERRFEAIQALSKKEQRYIIETLDRLLQTAS
jgi:transcriptional regulator with XRE-family HTH domain